MAKMSGEKISISYDENDIVQELSLIIPDGKITSVIGPNGCGKTTLLNALARIISIKEGQVILEGKNIQLYSTKEVARKIAILPQAPQVADQLTAGELVSYGRFPYQTGFRKLTKEDEEVIDWALSVTDTYQFKHRTVDHLSGGQRQKVWIAMALAQQTDIIFLDEPTAYLDMAHQLEILELIQTLNREQGTTIIMVLHDINQAIRFSDHIIAMKNGKIIAQGDTKEVVTRQMLADVFNIDAELSVNARTDRPLLMTYNLLHRS